MATVEAIARAALGDLAVDDSNVVLACRWVTDRYREFASRRLKQRRRVGVINIPAALTAGTVDVAYDVHQVFITSDAGEPTWNTDLVGRWFRAGQLWYRIIGYDAAIRQQLYLDGRYAENTAQNTGYTIVQREASLDPNAQFLGAFVNMRFRRPLRRMVDGEMDATFPNRDYSGAGPFWYTEAGTAADGSRLIEFYPYSTRIEQVGYVYWEKVPDQFEPREELPQVVDNQALKEGVLIDVYRWQAAQAAKEGKVELAAYYGNTAARQSAIWEKAQQRLSRADHGVDDLALVLDSAPTQYSYPHDARSEIYFRGRPMA